MSAENKIILIFSILFLIVIVLFVISIAGRGELMGWAKVTSGSAGNDSCPSGYHCMFVIQNFNDTDPPSSFIKGEGGYSIGGCGKPLEGGDDWAFCTKK